MAYLLALSSAALYGTADFLCGLASRRANTLVIVVTSQGCGLTLLVLSLPLLPAATPAARDLVWGGAAGLAGGVGVTLLYRALAVGRMAVVAPTTAVCAVTIPVVTSVVLGERLAPLTMLGIALAIVAIVLVSQQEAAASPVSVRARALPPGVGLALPSGVAIGLFFLALAETDAQAGHVASRGGACRLGDAVRRHRAGQRAAVAHGGGRHQDRHRRRRHRHRRQRTVPVGHPLRAPQHRCHPVIAVPREYCDSSRGSCLASTSMAGKSSVWRAPSSRSRSSSVRDDDGECTPGNGAIPDGERLSDQRTGSALSPRRCIRRAR